MSVDEFYNRYSKDTPDIPGEKEVATPEVGPTFSELIFEKYAQANQGSDEYYLTILHSIDDELVYTHKVVVTQGVAENATYLISLFLPFLLLYTIEEIYEAIETSII
jgi:hypothetical protein